MTSSPPARLLTSRMFVAVFALAGGLVALYLLLYSLGLSPLLCPTSGCETVQSSPYSKLFNLPISLYGLAWFGLITALSLLGLWNDWAGGLRIQTGLIALTAIGLLAYVPLTAIELFVIHAVCFWCVVSSLMMLGAFLAALAGRTS
jgi:uncharacterized membrane protein